MMKVMYILPQQQLNQQLHQQQLLLLLVVQVKVRVIKRCIHINTVKKDQEDKLSKFLTKLILQITMEILNKMQLLNSYGKVIELVRNSNTMNI